MILITGGTGTVGSQVVRQLAAGGTSTRVLARDPKKALRLSNVEVMTGDLSDSKALDAGFKGADAVFVLTNSTPASTALQIKVMDAAKRNGCRRIVRLSVLGADAKSPVMLSQWHAQADAYLKASGLKWTILQPGSFMQNLLGSAATIIKDGAFYGAAGEGKSASIDARDIAAAAVKVLTSSGHEGKTYTLTGKEALSYPEIATRLSAKLGKPVKYVNLPVEQFVAGLIGAGVPDWLAKDFGTMHAFQSTGGMAGSDPTLGTLIGKARTFDDFLNTYEESFKP